jgi:hypothetical protein
VDLVRHERSREGAELLGLTRFQDSGKGRTQEEE